MRPATIAFASPTLSFDRAGRHLAVIEPDAIALVDLARSQTTRIDHAGARATAAFDDQIWVATCDDELVRFDPAGRRIGDAVPLAFSTPALLAAAPCGPPAAVWGCQPALAIHDDFGELIRTELVAELAIPLTGRRHVIVRAGKLVLPSGIGAQLPGQGVLGGMVLADGKSVVLALGHSGQRQLVAVALATGAVVQRCAFPGTVVRLAARRGIALLLPEPRRLIALDLRSGRELGSVALDREIRDFAIDPDGERIVVRDATSCIELIALDELLRATSERAQDEAALAPEPVPAAITAPVPAVVAPPVVTPPEAWQCPTLVALGPRVPRAALDRSELLSQLDRELHRVALWTLRAITTGWDSRRIGYGNEGKHPYELEVAAILGMNSGHATEYVAAAHERLEAHEARIAGDPQWRSSDTPVGALIAELGLTPRAIDVLLVIAAGALWGEIARLHGILANDAGRANIDELVVQLVLAAHHDRHDIAAELEPRAPLVRLGLVQVSTRRAPPFAELSVDPVVLDLLRGRPPELGEATTVRGADRALATLDLAREIVAAATTSLARPHTATTRIVIRGRVGSGRTTLLAALAAEAGRELAVIDATALPRSIDGFQLGLRVSLRKAHLAGFVPCIVHLDDVTFDEHAARDVAAEVLRLHPGPIAVVTAPDAPSPFAAGHVAIELPVLVETERHGVWARAAEEAGLPAIDLDTLAARYRIGPGLIRRATAAARERLGDGMDATAVLDDFIRQTRDARLSQFARRVDRLATWANIVLPPDILDSLRELVGRVRHRRTVFDTWGMGRTMTTSRGLTALFQGSPGTGKTLVAGVIARELGLELYQVDLSKVMSKWIGETERNLSQIFDAAEDGQVVLLFDEADSLFAKRTEVRSSNDRYANLEVNYLLQRLDAFEGIAILTTNAGTSIDQAFKRRMSFRLSFPFPDEETREQLWRAHLPAELPIEGALALDTLARKYQLSGGYIRNACLRAAFLAAQQETALHQHHLERAVALEFAELGKLSTGGAID